MALEVDVNSQRLARTLFSHHGGFVLLIREDSENTNAVMRRLREQIPPDVLRVITPSTIPLPSSVAAQPQGTVYLLRDIDQCDRNTLTGFVDSLPATDAFFIAAGTQEWARDLASVEVTLSDLPQPAQPAQPTQPAQPAQRERQPLAEAEKALYGGSVGVAGDWLDVASIGKKRTKLAVMTAVADWDIEGLRQVVFASPTSDDLDPAVLEIVQHFAEAASGASLSQHLITLPVAPETDFLTGFMHLANDDIPRALNHLRPRPGESVDVSLWKAPLYARAQFVAGHWTDAKHTVEHGLLLAESNEARLVEPLLLWTGAQIAALEGKQRLAEHYLRRSDPGADAFTIQQLPSLMANMVIAAQLSDIPTALQAGENLARTAKRIFPRPEFWPWEDVYASSLIRAGHLDEAEQVLAPALDESSREVSLSVRAKYSIPMASIDLRRQHAAAAFSTFEDAVEMLRYAGMPAYYARCLYEYGLAARRYGRRNKAAEIMHLAAELYGSMGAWAMLRRCQAEQQIATAEHPASTLLTAHEREIAHMAASGETNSGIARQLNLSTKTIEYHLTRVYKKLGVNRRADLGSALRSIP